MSKRAVPVRQLTMEFIVGAVFVGALVILGVFTIILSSNKMRKLTYEYTVDFEQAGGLRVGDKVLLRGVEVGQVSDLSFPPENLNLIRIKFRSDRPLDFHEGYVIEVHTSSILGGSFLYLELGNMKGNRITDPILKGKTPLDVFSEAGRLVRKLNKSVDGLQGFIASLGNTNSTLYKIMNDDQLYKDISSAFRGLSNSATKIDSAIGEIKGISTSAKNTLAQFSKAAESVDKAGVGVKQAADTVSRAADSIRATSDSLHQVIIDARAGKGTVGQLLTNEKLYNDFQEAAAGIRTIAQKIAKGKSSIGKLLADDGAMYDSIKSAFDNFGGTMADAREIVATIRKGEGTIGKLIMDETIWKDLKQTIKDVQGAIEDYREQAPILTFGSFIFSSL